MSQHAQKESDLKHTDCNIWNDTIKLDSRRVTNLQGSVHG